MSGIMRVPEIYIYIQVKSCFRKFNNEFGRMKREESSLLLMLTTPVVFAFTLISNENQAINPA